MNEHLQLVFEILLPELERAGIQYWVYGGMGIAGVVGEFIRKNTDVDIFVEDADFENATSLLDDICRQNNLEPNLIGGRRPKFEVKVKATDRRDTLSVVPVYREDGLVKFIFRPRPARYPDQILERTPRNICAYSFFSPPDGYVKELFKTYLTNRPGVKGRKKIQTDAKAILTPEEFRAFFPGLKCAHQDLGASHSRPK